MFRGVIERKNIFLILRWGGGAFVSLHTTKAYSRHCFTHKWTLSPETIIKKIYDQIKGIKSWLKAIGLQEESNLWNTKVIPYVFCNFS